jgi:hypothetical protein
MYVCHADRFIFQLLLGPGQRAAEVGVYRGEYSRGLLARAPAELVLVDAWRMPDKADLLPSDCHIDAAARIEETFAEYYPGGMAAALAQAEREVMETLAGEPGVRILKMSSREAAATFADNSLDFVYIDANHRFDFVLSDLIRWSQKVAAGGCIVLNDCYVSQVGALQFLSVMEAASQFMKLHDWAPLALNTTAYGDLVLVRKDDLQARGGNLSALAQKIFSILIPNGIPFVEVPDALVHAAMHKPLRVAGQPFEYLSFA